MVGAPLTFDGDTTKGKILLGGGPISPVLTESEQEMVLSFAIQLLRPRWIDGLPEIDGVYWISYESDCSGESSTELCHIINGCCMINGVVENVGNYIGVKHMVAVMPEVEQ